ncbi:MAG TPA: FTR1 family protein [Nitrososphaeraceae archaeon]|nr:FTR1 family protein [Nitrososphaeraceae archaeon]
MKTKNKLPAKVKNLCPIKIDILIIIICSFLVTVNIVIPYVSSSYFIYAQSNNDTASVKPAIAKINYTNAIIGIVNFDRIRTQIKLTEKSLAEGDNDMAFSHAYIPHSVILPSIKNLLENTRNVTSVGELESALTDLPFMIRIGSFDNAKHNIIQVNTLLNNISNQTMDPVIKSNELFARSQTIIFLLKDADKSYQISNASFSNGLGQMSKNKNQLSKVDYQNSAGLVDVAKSDYDKISESIDSNRNSEINLSFAQLKDSIARKSDKDLVSRLVSTIGKGIMAGSVSQLGSNIDSQNRKAAANNNHTDATLINQYSQYFSTIRNLLQNVITETKKGNYQQADQAAVAAYLDNFEYLEPPIEKHDHKLKSYLELGMREHLRQMLKEKATSTSIMVFVKDVLSKLNSAEAILKSDPTLGNYVNKDKPVINGTISKEITKSSNGSNVNTLADINILSKGFGTYTGERLNIGQSNDSSKEFVRNNIDKIRLDLDEMLQQYRKRAYNEALSSSRSAYLNSYENIEIPLRPINPDFTLDMEIRFAQLRNLVQAKANYENVQNEVFKIRQGLDESERLVSGTGVVAPTIAFSTSFSIIFREGLESALIIGAVITYLEASRNYRFKKHVYYGIAIAIIATTVTWFIAQYIIEISGVNRELIEAIAGISAVAVLFWVSFWVLNKIETKKWIEFVKAKVWKATTTGSVLVFVMLSFFTIYREGFETVLFYQAMLSFAKYMEWYVIAGLVSGLGIIIGVVFLIRMLGKKLPLRVLFGLTMAVGAYMSIAFMGNTIRAFQEVGYISTTHMIGIIPRLDINVAEMSGIHPTLESVIAQVILLSIYIVGSLYILVLQPKRKKATQMSRKSMADIEKK